MSDHKKLTSSRWPHVPNEHWGLAQEMRREPTQAEHLLWQILRYKRLGVQFRRQHPFGPCILDFYAPEIRLVIELDGGIHDSRDVKEQDVVREEYLRLRQRVVVRFTNKEVLESLDEVIGKLRKVIKELQAKTPGTEPLSTPSQPSP